MSSKLLLAPVRSGLPLRVGGQSVRTAARADVYSAGDPRQEIIRRALYPANRRNKPTPTGTWRRDVPIVIQKSIPSVQAYNTIDRAWLLHQRHVRKSRDAELERKFNSMKKAMEELHELDHWLYSEANKQEDPRARLPEELELAKTMKASEKKTLDARTRGLFPREFKTPSDTPSTAGWNFSSKPFPRPL